MQITALDHLVLTTSNFELCVWFYRDVLGMELLCQNDHYAFRFGMQKINVHRCPAEFLPAAKCGLRQSGYLSADGNGTAHCLSGAGKAWYRG